MALTLFEDFVYWTDGKSKSLRRAHKTTGTQGMELLNSWQAIKSIKVYHSLRQPEGILSTCLPCPIFPWPSSRILQSFSSQTPVPDRQWRMQPPLSSVSRRWTQMRLSHEFLPGRGQQDVPVQLHLQSGQVPNSSFDPVANVSLPLKKRGQILRFSLCRWTMLTVSLRDR